MPNKKFIFVILDGWGLGAARPGNPIWEAKPATMNMLAGAYPAFVLQASGIAVGLPWGVQGNSEVGHANLGAGRIVWQYLPRIVEAMRDGSFFENPAFMKAAQHVKAHGSTLHIMGLLSSGSVHSYIDHLYGLLYFAKQQQISQVVLHVFTDGKDAPPQEGAKIIQNLQERLALEQTGRIGSLMGRSFAMDRSEHWDFTRRAYALLTQGKGNITENPVSYVQQQYEEGKTDVDIEPAIISTINNQQSTINRDETSNLILDNDAVIFFNFREDSARQLTQMFVMPPPEEVLPMEEGEVSARPQNILFVTMTRYAEKFPVEVAFPPEKISFPFARVLADAGYRQLHIAETEKYAHITYFFNGQQEHAFANEDRIIIPSQGAPHYERSPEMAAYKITQAAEEHFARYDALVINYANTDMVAHTGDFAATKQAIQIVDECLGRLFKLTQENSAYLFVTADHGHAEEMRDPRTGTVKTEHTAGPVPFIAAHPSLRRPGMYSAFLNMQPSGILADVAPTILRLIGINVPNTMTGKNLLE